MLNNGSEHFDTTLRSDFTTSTVSGLSEYYVLTGIKIGFSADGQQVSIQQIDATNPNPPILAEINFNFNVGQLYNFVITDTGNNVSLAIDGTNVLSAFTTFSTGGQIAFQSREFSTTSSSLDSIKVSKLFPLNARVSLHDDFNGSTVDTNLWAITLPEDDASVTESGGYVSLENAGRLVSQNSLTASYAIEGRFLMANNPYSNFKVMLRTDGVSLPSPSMGVAGIEIQFNILDDNGNPSNNLKIYTDEGIELGVVAANLTLDTWHTFRITDDGTNIALFFDGSSMPNLTANSTYSAGNKIALFNREGAGNGSSKSANGITEIGYITVTDFQPANTLYFAPNTGNGIVLGLLTYANTTYYIQASPDLITWTNYDGPFLGSGNFLLKTYSTTNQSQLFYRFEAAGSDQ
jgi:hypothetical protein